MCQSCAIDLPNVIMPANWLCACNPILYIFEYFEKIVKKWTLEDLIFVQIIVKTTFLHYPSPTIVRVDLLFCETKTTTNFQFFNLSYFLKWLFYSEIFASLQNSYLILIPTLLAFEKSSSYSRVIITRITQSVLSNLRLLANLVNSIIKISIVDLLFLMKIYDSDVFSLDNRLFFLYTLKWINCLIIDLIFYFSCFGSIS